MPLLYKLPVNHLQYPTMNLDYTVPSFTVLIIISVCHKQFTSVLFAYNVKFIECCILKSVLYVNCTKFTIIIIIIMMT